MFNSIVIYKFFGHVFTLQSFNSTPIVYSDQLFGAACLITIQFYKKVWQNLIIFEILGGVGETFDLNNSPVDIFKIMLKAYQRSSMLSCSIDPDPNVFEAR